MSRRLLVPLLLLVTLVVTASAAAKPVTVKFKERAGDAPSPALDIRAAQLSYDRASGQLVGTVSLGAAPTIDLITAVDFYLGRFNEGYGHCSHTYTALISIPDQEDVQAGLPRPYTELFRGNSAKAIGFLPTATLGSTINFNAASANPAVVKALKRGRFTCADVEAREPKTFKTRDRTKTAALINGPRPRCKLSRRSVVGGQSFPVRCKRAGKRVKVHLLKGRHLLTGKERVRRGRFSVPTTPSMRGKWTITIWKGDIVIGRFPGARVR